MAEMELLVRFPDQSESFTHGFEAGMYWSLMAHEADGGEFTVHTSNREIIHDMCEHLNYGVSFEDTEYEEWSFMTIWWLPPVAKPKQKLRVIDGGLKHEDEDDQGDG